MSKRRHEEGESTDLLLDTITNAFGGIVFLALLLAVIVNTSKPSAATPDIEEESIESVQRRNDYNSLRAKFISLEMTKESADSMANTISDADRKKFLRTLELKESLLEIKDDIKTQKSQVAQTSKAVEAAIEGNERRKSMLEQAYTDLDALEEQLDEERKSKVVSSELPKERSTKKSPEAFIIKNNRIVFSDVSSVTSQMERGNALSYDVVDTNDSKFYRIGNSSGIASTNSSQIRSYIGRLNPATEYLQIFIYPNSFDAMKLIKEISVQNNISYHLIPMETDEKISIGGGGMDGKIQ